MVDESPPATITAPLFPGAVPAEAETPCLEVTQPGALAAVGYLLGLGDAAITATLLCVSPTDPFVQNVDMLRPHSPMRSYTNPGLGREGTPEARAE